ncbi:MAG: 5-formyltetrahydrofolate cyclo-ligase [Methylococcaceae bacterium]|nr:5-formyltetrahydrofolate cyclo-ligase [Methylococcaceae bacterium]
MKHQQRKKAYVARNTQSNKNEISEIICQQLINFSYFKNASTIMCYLHCRSEVRTLEFVKAQLKHKKRIIIPYCTKDKNGENKLGLWHLEDLNELVAGTWGILEPPKTRWNDKSKNITAEELDLIIVPAVAFSRKGARLGNGAGYYDRLLNQVRNDCDLIGVGYESQLFEDIEMNEHDVYMDFVLTEKQLYKTGVRHYSSV